MPSELARLSTVMVAVAAFVGCFLSGIHYRFDVTVHARLSFYALPVAVSFLHHEAPKNPGEADNNDREIRPPFLKTGKEKSICMAKQGVDICVFAGAVERVRLLSTRLETRGKSLPT
jgi:hypothetical protein